MKTKATNTAATDYIDKDSLKISSTSLVQTGMLKVGSWELIKALFQEFW